MDVLGTTFNSSLTFKDKMEKLHIQAMQRSGMISRVAHQVPRGRHLKTIIHTFHISKLITDVVACFGTPRFLQTDPTCKHNLNYPVQVTLNAVCRTATGIKFSARKTNQHIVAKAGFESFNRLRSTMSACAPSKSSLPTMDPVAS